MKKLLVRFQDNWADEMDVSGFLVMTEDMWNIYLDLKNHPELFPYVSYFGTNEEIEYTTAENFLRNFTAEEISETELETLKRLFPSYNSRITFGHFPDGPDVEEEDDDHENDDGEDW